RMGRSLPALLHVPADELLRVLFQHRIDLVEKVVDLLGDLLMPLRDLWVHLGRDVVDLLVAPATPGLRLSSRVPGCRLMPPVESGGEFEPPSPAPRSAANAGPRRGRRCVARTTPVSRR